MILNPAYGVPGAPAQGRSPSERSKQSNRRTLRARFASIFNGKALPDEGKSRGKDFYETTAKHLATEGSVWTGVFPRIARDLGPPWVAGVGVRATRLRLSRGTPARRPRHRGRDNTDSSVFQPPERELLRHLSAGSQFLSEERFSEAVQHLGKILEHPRDYFYKIPDKKGFTGIKKFTLDIIGRMSDGGRQAFELQYGTTAKRLLENALTEGDFSEILNISRRYFHTKAGYEATYLVGIALFDRGEPLAAALKLQELQQWPQAWESLEPGLSLAETCCWLQCGDREKAEATAKRLLGRDPDFLQSWRPSGTPASGLPESPKNADELLALLEVQLPSAATFRTASLENWMMPGGNPARSGEAKGGVPLLRRIWSIPHAEKPLVDACLQWADQECRRAKVPMLPSLQPIVVNDRVFMRNIDTLTAVDFNSGKRLWEAPIAPTDMQDAKLAIQQRAQNAANTSLRMWLDRTYGTLSSDGARVFAVEDLVVPGSDLNHLQRRVVVFPGGAIGGMGPFGSQPDPRRC